VATQGEVVDFMSSICADHFWLHGEMLWKQVNKNQRYRKNKSDL